MRPDAIGLLEDIRVAAETISADTTGATLESFTGDRRMRQLVERNFIIIGEAINRIVRVHPEIAVQISEISKIVGLRNILVHQYQTIDHRTVWGAVSDSLPVLRREVEQLLLKADVDESEHTGSL